MRLLIWILPITALALVACGPNEKQLAERAEKKRIACLDKFCEGDVEPVKNPGDTAIKLNGVWYVGPQTYFTPFGVRPIHWWHRKPVLFDENAPLEMKQLAKEGKAYDFMVEIFLRSNNAPIIGVSRYQALIDAEKQGRLLSKSNPRDGLEIWRVRDAIQGMPPSVWYVASHLKDNEGLPPVLGCDDQNPKFDRCTMAFTWQPGVAVDMRFQAKHGPDWPGIYQEMIRVLNLLKKA